MVTNGDKGGRGVWNSQFCGDVIFEWPLTVLVGLPVTVVDDEDEESSTEGQGSVDRVGEKDGEQVDQKRSVELHNLR